MKEVLVVTLTIDELRGIVQEEVRKALEKSALKVWYSEAEAQSLYWILETHALQCAGG